MRVHFCACLYKGSFLSLDTVAPWGHILYIAPPLVSSRAIVFTEIYTHLINFESDEWHVAHAENLEEEDKLIQAGFEYVRYSKKYKVAIYRKRK